MPREYHLIGLDGISYGGFVSLFGARQYAREEVIPRYQIYHGNVRVETHDPGPMSGEVAIALTNRDRLALSALIDDLVHGWRDKLEAPMPTPAVIALVRAA